MDEPSETDWNSATAYYTSATEANGGFEMTGGIIGFMGYAASGLANVSINNQAVNTVPLTATVEGGQ